MGMSAGTAEKIRDAAHNLIASKGYAGFSYADVADVVGIRKASIHHHFPTKVDLVVAALKEHRSQLMAATSGLNEGISDPLQRLKLYVQHWEGCIRSNNRPICIAALLGAELPGLPQEIRSEVEAHYKDLSGWFRATLKEGVKRGSIRLDHSVEAEAQSFVALIHGAMFSARVYGSPGVFTLITKGAMERLRNPS